MVPEVPLDSNGELRRNDALLSLTDILVGHDGLPELLQELARRLHPFVSFDLASICLHDPAKNVFSLRCWEGGELVDPPAELPLDDTTAGWVWQNQKPISFDDVQTESVFPTCLDILRSKGVRSFCELPLTASQRRFGTLGFGSFQASVYSNQDLDFLQRVAHMVTLAVENAFARGAVKQEKERLQMLLEVNAALVPNLTLQDSFPAISGYVRKVIGHHFASITLYDEATQHLRKYAVEAASVPGPFLIGEEFSAKGTLAGEAFLAREPRICNRDRMIELSNPIYEPFLREGVQTLCCIPLIAPVGPLGTLNLASKQENAFSPRTLAF